MKVLKYLLVCLLVFTSCKAKKYVMGTPVIAEKMSAKKVAKKHVSVYFDKQTIDAKLSANFDNGKINQSISVYMRIDKDKVIWLKGTKFITIFKAKITPTSVSYYSPYAKNYFEGNFSILEKILGTEINYNQLQNLLLGQSILDLKENKQDVEIVNNTYVLRPQSSDGVFHKHFGVNPGHFKLDFQSVINVFTDQMLQVKYPAYRMVKDEIFPQEINIQAKQGKQITKIDFTLKSVEFNTAIDTSFSIPNGYKRIDL
ncbi:DUF4292 domain-containing protein [Polaribacter aestuariivivens]|uniref:DUF4292 domain-containing protein n=2 Tax=Polaribacter aestuariivivens TaxID=2304626 RepID=A0A5S3N8Y4_9FLAO|nr:DUF4292 domain-containing protein [Polaribacter aestuariivivens]